jgi:hypothetical protein
MMRNDCLAFNPSGISAVKLCNVILAFLLTCSLTGHAADFSVEDIKGKMHRLSDYRGKWVLVNY